MSVVVADGERLSPEVEDAVRRALLADELLVYPTDTLYALGALALRPEAVRRVRAAKGREEAKPLPVVAADIDQVRVLCGALPPGAMALALAFWPGPLTLVLAASTVVPAELTTGGGTVAIRVPGRELTRQLCRIAGPLISTSANRAGVSPADTCEDVVAALGLADVLAIDGGTATAIASTIVDARGEQPQLLRAGAAAWEAVRRVWP